MTNGVVGMTIWMGVVGREFESHVHHENTAVEFLHVKNRYFLSPHKLKPPRVGDALTGISGHFQGGRAFEGFSLGRPAIA